MHQSRLLRSTPLLSLFALWMLFATACADDTASGTGDTDGTTTTSSSSTTSGADATSGGADTSTSGADGSSGGTDPAPDICDDQLDANGSAFGVLIEPLVELDINDELEDAGVSGVPFYCDQSNIIVDQPTSESGLARDDTLELLVYRPDAGNGQWPSAQLPLVLLTPGNGLEAFDSDNNDAGDVPPPNERYYDHIIEPLVRRGAVVIAVQTPTLTANEQVRLSQLACASIWSRDAAGWAESQNGRLSGALVLAGHSRGGGGVFQLTRLWPDFQASVGEMASFELCSSVGIGPRWNDFMTDATNVDGEVPLPLGRDVPFLVVAAAADEDVRGQPLSMYDAVAPEDNIDASNEATMSPYDKAIVWSYAIRHVSFGGAAAGAAVNEDIGRAVSSVAVDTFLSWQMADADHAVFRQAFENLADPEATGTGISELDDPNLWVATSLGAQEFYTAYGDRPPIYVNLSEGVRPLEETSDGVLDRIVIDTLARRDAAGELQSLGTGSGQPADWLSPTAADSLPNLASVTVSGLPGTGLWHGDGNLATDDLHTQTDQDFDRHQTTLLRADWDDTVPNDGATIEWQTTPLDVSQHGYLSLRLGMVFEKVPQDTCLSANETSANIDIELVFEDNGMQTSVSAAESGILLEQQVANALNTSLETDCTATSAMHTVRIPLARFCDQGNVNAERLVAVRLRLLRPGDSIVRRILVDSLEVTRDELDDPDAYCGLAQGAWTCTPSQLVVEEHSCAATPIAGACSTADEETDPLVPPTYDFEGTTGSGWVVHTPRGWVGDLLNPTAAELDSVSEMCARACAQEYSDQPEVTATCDSTSAFATPTLISVNSSGSEPRIADSLAWGSELFGQSSGLTCDLRTTCCFDFDEALCSASPARLTVAPTGLAEKTERVLKLQSGYTNVSLITPGSTTTKTTKGVVSFSKTTDEDADGYRPFFLGSFGVEREGLWGHSDTCPDGSTLQLWIKDLSIDMLQPTFGIEEVATGQIGVPPGALRMLATFEANGGNYAIEGWNEDNVYFEAQEFYFEATDVDVAFSVPCGDSELPVVARFNVKYSQVLAIGPEVEAITTPHTVACGTSVSLTADVKDLDNDLVATRWYADGVLLAADVDTVRVDSPLLLRAVATDARGATSSLEKTVDCL